VSPLRGEKPQNRPLSKLNTGRHALRAMLPVITMLREGHARQISPTWSNSQLISWLHAMVAKHHALPRRNAASSCGHRKQESQQQHQNCVVCHQQLKHLSKIFTQHFQVAQWYSALSGDPPPLNDVDYEWEADGANKCVIP